MRLNSLLSKETTGFFIRYYFHSLLWLFTENLCAVNNVLANELIFFFDLCECCIKFWIVFLIFRFRLHMSRAVSWDMLANLSWWFEVSYLIRRCTLVILAAYCDLIWIRLIDFIKSLGVCSSQFLPNWFIRELLFLYHCSVLFDDRGKWHTWLRFHSMAYLWDLASVAGLLINPNFPICSHLGVWFCPFVWIVYFVVYILVFQRLEGVCVVPFVLLQTRGKFRVDWRGFLSKQVWISGPRCLQFEDFFFQR